MSSNSKRIRHDSNSLIPSKKNKLSVFPSKRKDTVVWIDLIKLNSVNKDGVFDNVGCNSFSGELQPGRVYTVGRKTRNAEFVFDDSRVSKRHCQFLFDGFYKKLYLLNGALLIPNPNNCDNCGNNCVVSEFRSRLIGNEMGLDGNGPSVSCCSCRYVYKSCLNGVFVNGVSVSEGLVVELRVGDEVLLVCGSEGRVCSDFKTRVGFVVRRIVLDEELVGTGFDGFRVERPRFVRPSKRVLAVRGSETVSLRSDCGEVVCRAKCLLAHCNHIVGSYDPVSCIRRCMGTHSNTGELYFCQSKEKNGFSVGLNGNVESLRTSVPQENVSFSERHNDEKLVVNDVEGLGVNVNVTVSCEVVVPLEPIIDNVSPKEGAEAALGTTYNYKATTSYEHNGAICEPFVQKEGLKTISPPGKSFYLNRLDSMDQSSPGQEKVVSLPELLHPVSSISKMFIATFTSDIGWFLSYCDIPSHLPITIACHNTERCWSADPGKRTCVPNPDFPNLIAVYPPFPEVIAFGKDRKNKGVGCHHPKLLVLQREDSIRVIVTSANLVPKQWKSVTNTIWWQDFPRRVFPDCTSLFNKLDEDMKKKPTSDFAAQLAGFIACLITDVPSQAYWIVELTKYDFAEANAHLIASVPGIHSYRSMSTSSTAFKPKCSGRFLGSVVASVVGLSHRFQGTADPNGAQLKKLASYLGLSREQGSEMSEIILRRETNIPQDANAVSVLVSNHKQICNEDCVQLGFLPRTIAKWVSPLWDDGFFTFHGYVCPREALAAASGESNTRVPLLLYVSQGPNAQEVTKTMKPEHIVAFCSLIASLQRCTGLWRLEEVLHRYTWPESLESDFIYGASSIGTAVGAQFMAAFSAAVGKKSLQAYDSQESDPEWGRWNADYEMKCPSIRIIFPTIERVKNSHCGILPSKYTLSFPEKTWQRLKTVDILHDAIPHPSGRVGHPMHIKVARRRFKSKTGASSGWVYSGSHNISAAAWGRPMSSQSMGPQNGNSSGSRLHVCNYELGLLFTFPPPGPKENPLKNPPNLEDINLPFVVPAPKYGLRDRPATMRAMSEALAELAAREGTAFTDVAPAEEMVEVEEDVDEEDNIQVANYAAPEADEEKAYADVLWHQVDSSQSC